MHRTIIAAFFALATTHVVVGQDSTNELPSTEEVQAAFIKAAKQYEITRDSSREPLRLVETPALKWVNPGREDQHGIVFVWEEDGLPMVVGSFFTFHYKGFRAKHEFHSLADDSLTAKYKGKVPWSPSEAGVDWKLLRGFKPPSESKSLRLTQMKAIANQFEIVLHDSDGQLRNLRLLRTPLHRFSSAKNSVVDGAIFSYTVATDPEALLVVVAKRGQWHYAFARFHYRKLVARQDGKVVWSAELDISMEGNFIGDEPERLKTYNSFYPEPDALFRP